MVTIKGWHHPHPPVFYKIPIENGGNRVTLLSLPRACKSTSGGSFFYKQGELKKLPGGSMTHFKNTPSQYVATRPENAF